MTTKTKNQYNDLLAELTRTNKQNKLSIYIPSQQDYLDFTPITVSHQKDIITSAITSTLNQSDFNILVNTMITNCCTKKTTFYSIDRDPILIGLRCHMLGFDIHAHNAAGKDIYTNIEKHYNTWDTITMPEGHLDSKTIEYDGISIEIEPPTIDIDTEVSKKTKSTISKMIENDRVNEIIGEAIIYELIKYIKSINISKTSIQFAHSDVIRLTKIVEALPLKLSKSILTEIDRIKSYEKKFTDFTVDGEELSFLVDARFFNGE